MDVDDGHRVGLGTGRAVAMVRRDQAGVMAVMVVERDGLGGNGHDRHRGAEGEAWQQDATGDDHLIWLQQFIMGLSLAR